jgi:hypothetical protein
MPADIFENSPVPGILRDAGGVSAGRVGAILARAGVGKSTLLVHVALDALLRDVPVLHVSLRDTVDHVRAFYDEIFAALARSRNVRERAAAMVAAERHRMIHSYADRAFGVDQLEQNLTMLRDVAQFVPELLVVDGLDERTATEHLGPLAAFAAANRMVVWVTLRGADDAPELSPWMWEHVALALRLTPEDATVRIDRLSPTGATRLGFALDPTTMLVRPADDGASAPPPHAPRAAECTVYSGGANGAEEEFGELAEAWGVNEVNFTFDGHKQTRSRGRYELSPRELAAGDVSLVYVSRRLNRTYSEGSLIRRVLQTIWHMVSRSQQVFVIGEIQADGTVKGGTGWAVELARMWNKTLWVYDQDRSGWYRWDGVDWVAGEPTIDSVHFTGTGTRYLTEPGKAAVKALFERSFGRREG